MCASLCCWVWVWCEGEDVCHCVCGGPAFEPPPAHSPPPVLWLPPRQWPCPFPLLPPNCSLQGVGGAGAAAPPPHPGPINSSRARAGAGASGWSSKGVGARARTGERTPPARAQVSLPFLPSLAQPCPGQPGPASVTTSSPAPREVSGPAQPPHYHPSLPISGDLQEPESGDGRQSPRQPRPSLKDPESHMLWGGGQRRIPVQRE